MRAEGSTHYVSGQKHVPLPSRNQPISPRVPDVECSCRYRGRPGAFHIHIEPDTPEPTPLPKPKPKAAPKRVAAEPKTADAETTEPGKRRGRPLILTDEKMVEAARMYTEDGLPVSDIADHFGVSSKAIRNALKRRGVPSRPTGVHAPRRRGAA